MPIPAMRPLVAPGGRTACSLVCPPWGIPFLTIRRGEEGLDQAPRLAMELH